MPPLSLMPLLPFTVVFIIGIILQGSGMSAGFMAVPLVAAAVMLFMKKNYAAILLCGLTVGYVVAFVHAPVPLHEDNVDVSRRYSAVAKDVRRYEPAQVLIAEVDSADGVACRPFLVKLTVPSSLPEVLETDRIRFSASVAPMRSKTELPEEIDYDAPLRRRGVVGECFVRPDSLDVLYAEPGLLNSIRRLRPEMTRRIATSPLSPRAKEFVNATLTGDRSILAPEMCEIFSYTGLSHILALSGLHIGILLWIASILLFPLYVAGMRGTRTLLLILLLWAFAVMTGLAPSVVRSVIMATLFLLAYAFQRTRSPLNSLCAAAVAILFVTPHALYTVGFQLSFLAVASILLFSSAINPVSQRRRLLYTVVAYPAATIAAMLGTMALSAYYFNILPLYFLPANFVGALLLPLILGLGVLYLLLAACGIAFHSLADAVSALVDVFYNSASWLSGLPLSFRSDIYLTPLMLACWLAVLVPLVLWLYRRRPVFACATGVMVLFALSMTIFARVPDSIEVYIPESRGHTSLLVRDSSLLSVVTTLPPYRHDELRESFVRKYRRYLLSRRIDSIHIQSISPAETVTVSVGDRKFAVVCDRAHLVSRGTGHVDYALVSASYRGDILAVAEALRPDTVLLSGDINIRRHDRYRRELAEAWIPVRSIRDAPFSYIISYAP